MLISAPFTNETFKIDYKFLILVYMVVVLKNETLVFDIEMVGIGILCVDDASYTTYSNEQRIEVTWSTKFRQPS